MVISRSTNSKMMSPLRRAFRAALATALRTFVVVVLVAPGASAASITIPPGTLTATSVTGTTGAPTVYIWDHFDRANGSIGSAVVGGIWGQSVGTWTISGNVARCTNTATGNATITVPGVVDARVDVDMTFGTTAQAGLDFDDDGAGLNNMMVLYRKTATISQVRLHTWIGNVAFPAPVATANVASATSASVTVIAVGSSVQVFWNGGLVISYTLNATEVAALKDAGSNQFGLWAESDSTSRFNNFRVQSP